MIDRRRFLVSSAASVALGGCSRLNFFEPAPSIVYPGMREGHLLRDQMQLPQPSGEITTDVVILGGGIAGLTAAWKLSKEGFRQFTVVNGPEAGGNAAGGRFEDLAYPRGAHYIPLPSRESTHVREMLFDFGVILDRPMAERPYFDEACIVHAPDERIFFNGIWQEGIVPSQGLSTDEASQHQRFFKYIDTLKQARGSDGKRAFAIPIVLSSTDPQWRQLDTMTVREWLTANTYTSETLHWYLNYVCRDEYGAEYDKVSAWAGLHYFASRGGQARNASEGAVLTWPDGLHALVRKLTAAIDRHRAIAKPWQRNGFAVRVDEKPAGVEVLCAEQTPAGIRTFIVKAKRVVCAMPLMLCARVVPDLARYGFVSERHMPSYAPWLVSNFLMNGFPSENEGAPLAWDNVIYQGRGLGYVVSTHQDIRVAAPPKTVFSAYQALSGKTPSEVRRWLAKATPHELFEEAAHDLKQAYGFRLERHLEALEITVRGHGMASPLRGFLSNNGLQALRGATGKVLFAHSDLSGYSVFEEAAWWGYQAAARLLT